MKTPGETVHVIEDQGKHKSANDPTLSPRALDIVLKVEKTNAQWMNIAKWGRETLEAASKKGTNATIGLALVTYENLRKKLACPLWKATQSDQDIEGQMFAIQATYSRILRLVPDAFDKAQPKPVDF